MWALYLFWPAFLLLNAIAQANILPALRNFVPETAAEARPATNALHRWLLAAYCLPLGLAGWLPVVWWKWALAAGLSRLLFDPLINSGSGVPVLYVGITSFTDRAIRRIAPTHPERFALLLRLSLAGAGVICLFIW